MLSIIGILVLPVPADRCSTACWRINIGVSVLILLVALSVLKPLDFSVFPSLLLITTLFRLGLNVATTRLILTSTRRRHRRRPATSSRPSATSPSAAA